MITKRKKKKQYNKKLHKKERTLKTYKIINKIRI